MADVAHDASGPASPKSGDVAPQQASRPDSPDRGKLRVFISYSRDDLYFADQLNAALDLCGFECFIDRHGISGGEEWKRRLNNLISEADTVVFLLSPTSARSEICDWEVEEATRLGKRILPIICRPLEGTSPPPRLRERNYIFFYDDPKAAPGSGFGTGLTKLVAALNTDFDWLREHTRYLQRATEWDRGGRPANRLLSGDDIAEAKAWAARRPKNAPEPTPLHLDFIRASEEEAQARSNARRKQLEAMAAAQAERETALKKAEDAQRKRATMARIRNIALVAVSIFALLAGWLFIRADERQTAAYNILAYATQFIWEVAPQMSSNNQKAVFEMFQTGAENGLPMAMWMLGNFYEKGYGVAKDYIKAREWFEKAADNGQPNAMADLGWIYADGRGVAKDYAKAREWFEKAAANGDTSAKGHIEQLSVLEAIGARRFAEALQLQEAQAVKWEEIETKREGKPGGATARELQNLAFVALFARDFTKALTAADRAHALLPEELKIEISRAHALMFLDRERESKAIYLAHKGEPVPREDRKLWERLVVEDFAAFRKEGLTHPMMADIEKELGVSP